MLTITRSLLCSALLLASSLTSVVVAAPQYRPDVQHRRGCGTHISAARRTSAEKRFQTHRVPAAHPNANATLNVHFHVVSANETVEGGWVSQETIDQQIQVLNDDYKNTHVSFNLVNVTRISSPEWFAKVAPESPEELQMKKSFRYGGPETLNVWTVGFLEGDGAGLLGYATFPSDYEGAPELDGVVLLYGTMPGGPKAPYNKGRTLTHEVGHWVGLYHTFEGGCTGRGDYVEDTTPQREASYGCPANPPVSCPGGEADPVENFMNYSDDSCMTGFTEGQITRLRTQIRTFRSVDV